MVKVKKIKGVLSRKEWVARVKGTLTAQGKTYFDIALKAGCSHSMVGHVLRGIYRNSTIEKAIVEEAKIPKIGQKVLFPPLDRRNKR